MIKIQKNDRNALSQMSPSLKANNLSLVFIYLKFRQMTSQIQKIVSQTIAHKLLSRKNCFVDDRQMPKFQADKRQTQVNKRRG